MTHTLRLALILVATLAACGGEGDYPELLPTSQLLAEPAVPVHAQTAVADPAPVEAATISRAEALRARARALQGPVVPEELRRAAMR
ncbi:hypothetical protein [Paracoccus sp. R86501]|uniref:hypothetical protein n=1 Tax=Paracoccus sp. R86501 TaxID=3101711 RepID=UPI0036700536